MGREERHSMDEDAEKQLEEEVRQLTALVEEATGLRSRWNGQVE